MLLHKNSNTPYSYGMMMATTAASSLPFFTVLFFTVTYFSCLSFISV